MVVSCLVRFASSERPAFKGGFAVPLILEDCERVRNFESLAQSSFIPGHRR